MAPQYHERIFGLFRRLDTEVDGTGVGLTIVERAVEIHGGRVWIESVEGEGATFIIALPREPAIETPGAAA